MDSPEPVVMTMTLAPEARPPSLPAGARIAVFDALTHPGPCHELLLRSYADGQGEVADFDRWWSAVRDDPEYDPRCMFVAVDERDEVAAFAHCWTSGFLKDFAVAPDWRRRGLGTAVLARVFETFRRDGFGTVRLKVRADNRPAIAFYEALGMDALV